MAVIYCRYGGFSLGARSSQFLAHADETDRAIAQLRRRFHLERVRDFITLCTTSSINRSIMACFDFVGIRLLQGVCLCCYNYSCTDDKHGILLQVWAVSVYTCAKKDLAHFFCLLPRPFSRELQQIVSFTVFPVSSKDWTPRITSRLAHTRTHETAVIQQHVALDITVKPPWSIPSTMPLLNLQLAHKMCSTQPICYLCWVCHR